MRRQTAQALHRYLPYYLVLASTAPGILFASNLSAAAMLAPLAQVRASCATLCCSFPLYYSGPDVRTHFRSRPLLIVRRHFIFNVSEQCDPHFRTLLTAKCVTDETRLDLDLELPTWLARHQTQL